MLRAPRQSFDGKGGEPLTPQDLKTDKSQKPRSLEVHCLLPGPGPLREEGAEGEESPVLPAQLTEEDLGSGERVPVPEHQAREGSERSRNPGFPGRSLCLSLSLSSRTEETQSVTSVDSKPSASVC